MRALIISANGFEDSELVKPLSLLLANGVEVDIAAPRKGLITGKHCHKVDAGLSLDAVRLENYTLLLLPGGEAPASLRKNSAAVAIARHFLQVGKPVAAICRGPQVLIATGLLAERNATCYRDMRQEFEAAGVTYEDREVVVDDNLITSRQPVDIPAFVQAIFRVIGLLH